MNNNDLKKETIDFLNSKVTAAVATVSPTGEPQVATMYFYSDDQFNFYFLTARGSHKINNIEVNNKVAIVVGFGPETICVQVAGTAEIGHEFKDEFIKKIMDKISFHKLDQWPVLLLEKEGLVLLKVKPESLVLMNFDKEGHPITYSHDFSKLEL